MSDVNVARLGNLISTHKPSFFYLFALVPLGLGLGVGGVFVYANGGGVAALCVAVAALLLMALLLAAHFKKSLSIYEKGLYLRSIVGDKVVIWQNLEKVNVTYNSYVAGDPDTILKVSMKQNDGSKVGFDMNWLRRKELIKHLAPIILNKK